MSEEGIIHLWDMATTNELVISNPPISGELSLAFAPDSQTFATAGTDGSVRLWDVDTITQIATFQEGEGGYGANPIGGSNVIFSPNGDIVVSAIGGHMSFGGYARLWDIQTQAQIAAFDCGHFVADIGFTQDQNTLLLTGGGTMGSAGEVCVWDIINQAEVYSLSDEEFSGGIDDMVSPEGNLLSIADMESNSRLMDELRVSVYAIGLYWGTTSSNRQVYASIDVDKTTVRLWDVASAVEMISIEGQWSEVSTIGFAPNSQKFFLGDKEGTIHVWDITTLAKIATLTGHTSAVDRFFFSSDGGLMASIGRLDGTVHVWDMTTYTEVAQLTGHISSIRDVVFAPDGQTIATVGYDSTIRIWSRAE